MAIEVYQKVADILLKSVAATAIAAGGLYVSLNKNKLDEGSICLSMSEKLYGNSDDSAPLERRQRRMANLIDRYNDACTNLSENETEFLMNSLGAAKTAELEQPSLPTDPRIIGHDSASGKNENERQAEVGSVGWMAIGRIGGSYGQVNFDQAESILRRPLPSKFVVRIKARWPVNVRDNTGNTQQRGNAVRFVLDAGDCVEAGDLTEVRGQVWTLGKVANCN
jgi:hypothetical protein